MTAGQWLVVIASALTLVAGIDGRVPLWVPVLLICIALLQGVGRVL